MSGWSCFLTHLYALFHTRQACKTKFCVWEEWDHFILKRLSLKLDTLIKNSKQHNDKYLVSHLSGPFGIKIATLFLIPTNAKTDFCGPTWQRTKENGNDH